MSIIPLFLYDYFGLENTRHRMISMVICGFIYLSGKLSYEN
jgi:hypothetical protein